MKESDGQEKSPEIDKMYSKQELRNAQQNDSSLDKVRKLAQEEPSRQESSYFIIQSGILYRVFITSSNTD